MKLKNYTSVEMRENALSDGWTEDEYNNFVQDMSCSCTRCACYPCTCMEEE